MLGGVARALSRSVAPAAPAAPSARLASARASSRVQPSFFGRQVSSGRAIAARAAAGGGVGGVGGAGGAGGVGGGSGGFSSGAGGSGRGGRRWLLALPVGAAGVASVSYAKSADGSDGSGSAPPSSSEPVPRHVPPEWERALADRPGTVLALRGEDLLDSSSPFLEDDHMFSAFLSKGILRDLRGYYDSVDRRWHSVVALGLEVCGFPRVVHGGLTAAVFDETFGGLLFALKKDSALPFYGHAYTVQLDVTYKARVPAGKTLLCSAEVERVEGRKLWMHAALRDGPDGKVYATARALFVAPKPTRAIVESAIYEVRRRLGWW